MRRPPNMGREILFQLADVARSMRTYIDQCAREHGMTRAQWGVLVRLQRQEGMTQAEMADSLEIQPISLVRLIDRLCQHGLVERRPHPHDRRANRLYLTEKGHTSEVLASLNEADAAALLQKLLLIKTNIRNATGKRDAANEANGKPRQG